MPTNVVVPNLGESVSEAVLLKWSKNDGEAVSKDDPVAELETDKANVDLVATAAGTLRHGKAAGDTVKVGESVATIEEGAPASAGRPADAGAAAAPVTAPPKGQGPATATAGTSSVKPEDLSPAVRTMVEENRLDAGAIAGTGRGGRVTKEDVSKYVADRPAAVAPDRAADDRKPAGGNGNAAPTPKPPPRPSDAPPPAPARAPEPGFDEDGIKRVPMSRIRKAIARNLVQAQQTAAILTTFNEVDLTAVMAIRAKYKDKFQEVYGVGLGLMSFFSRAVVLALREFQRVNAFLQGDDVVYHNYVHLGIAVSTERGLVVPVLRHADRMSFAKIEQEIKRVATAARDNKVSLEELSGGTFTITNGGVFGSLLSTPILSPPQSGILGMHTIQKRPVAVGDKVEIHPMMYVALSYDHRVVDGRESVSFLVRIKEYLEDPARLMLEI